MSSTCRDCGKMFGSCAAAQQHHRDAHLKSQRKFSVDEAEGDVIGEDRLATSTARPTLTMSSEIADRETTSTTPASPAHRESRSSVDEDAAARFCEYFSPSGETDRAASAPMLLTSAQRADLESALFAHTSAEDNAALYLNVGAPFCLVAVGMQGAGKSHTAASVLEACVLPLPPSMESIVKLEKPMAALVFHYDQVRCSFLLFENLMFFFLFV